MFVVAKVKAQYSNQKLRSDHKNLDDQARSGRLKNVNSEAMLQADE